MTSLNSGPTKTAVNYFNCVNELRTIQSWGAYARSATSKVPSFYALFLGDTLSKEALETMQKEAPFLVNLTFLDAWEYSINAELQIICSISKDPNHQRILETFEENIHHLLALSRAYHTCVPVQEARGLVQNPEINPFHFNQVSTSFNENKRACLTLPTTLTSESSTPSSTSKHSINNPNELAYDAAQLKTATDRLFRLLILGNQQLKYVEEALSVGASLNARNYSAMTTIMWDDAANFLPGITSEAPSARELIARVQLDLTIKTTMAKILGVRLVRSADMWFLTYLRAHQENLDSKSINYIYAQLMHWITSYTSSPLKHDLDGLKRKTTQKNLGSKQQQKKYLMAALESAYLEDSKNNLTLHSAAYRLNTKNSRNRLIKNPDFIQNNTTTIIRFLKEFPNAPSLKKISKKPPVRNHQELFRWESDSLKKIRAIHTKFKNELGDNALYMSNFLGGYRAYLSTDTATTKVDPNRLFDVVFDRFLHIFLRADELKEEWIHSLQTHQRELIQNLATTPKLHREEIYENIYATMQNLLSRHEDIIGILNLEMHLYAFLDDPDHQDPTNQQPVQDEILELFKPAILKVAIDTAIAQMPPAEPKAVFAKQVDATQLPEEALKQDEIDGDCGDPSLLVRATRSANNDCGGVSYETTESSHSSLSPSESKDTISSSMAMQRKPKVKTRGIADPSRAKAKEIAESATGDSSFDPEKTLMIENEPENGTPIRTTGYWLRMKERELLTWLHNLGWEKRNQTGSHAIYENPSSEKTITVPLHGGGKCIAKGTLSAILKILADENEEVPTTTA